MTREPDNRLELYRQGLSDREIARQVARDSVSICNWRKRRGLPANPSKFTETSRDDHKARLKAYKAGMIDIEIGQVVGRTGACIEKWRNRHDLPANHKRRDPGLSRERRAARMILYQMGRDDRAIGREVGITQRAVAKWRQRWGLASNWGSRRTQTTDPHKDILARIRRAVGRALPRDIADDAVGDMFVAVMSGELDLDEIEKASRKYGNRVLDTYASRFGPRSLDEEIGDDGDGFRMIDLIRDDRSSSWLEEMGASAW